MKAYKFKTDNEKDIFQAFMSERQNVDMFDFAKCNGVRFTKCGDLHLIKCLEYRDIELVDKLEDFILMCN